MKTEIMRFEPAYLETARRGILGERIRQASERLAKCRLCPRACETDRLTAPGNICKTGRNAVVYSHAPHFGEEPPLVGRHGSGTIFFSNCNLRCVFCQNYDISLEGCGREVPSQQLARMMLDLQGCGCHNINFVTPSHVVPQILAALELAVDQGLRLPLVYNTSAYDTVETLRLLDGVIDIYMPDFKFWHPEVARRACKAKDYPEVARKAIAEMHRQVGDLIVDDAGVAQRGLLLRHLALPDDLAGTRPIMRFIANEVSPRTYVNIMAQYRPHGKARAIDGLHRPVSAKEYRQALHIAREEGLTRLDNRFKLKQ